MATQTVSIAGLGEVLLVKRRGTRRIKLSFTPDGTIRVSMPYWVPYSAGINFARSKSDWLLAQESRYPKPFIADGSRVGKTFTVVLRPQPSTTFRASLRASELSIMIPIGTGLAKWQTKLRAAAERALKKEAVAILPPRVAKLAKLHGLNFKSLKIRKMTSRWGSCSDKAHITLSYYLVQLPWELIDYVIIHELLHTRYMHHGPKFWQAFEEILPGAKKIRKDVNRHRPALVIDP